jgi:hypothetical protein
MLCNLAPLPKLIYCTTKLAAQLFMCYFVFERNRVRISSGYSDHLFIYSPKDCRDIALKTYHWPLPSASHTIHHDLYSTKVKTRCYNNHESTHKQKCIWLISVLNLIFSFLVLELIYERKEVAICWTKHHTMNKYGGSGRLVAFKPRPLYPRGKFFRYKLDRRKGGLQIL